MSTNSNVYSPISYKLEIKRLVVNEFRNYFQNISQSHTMNEIKCTLEYPNSAEKYPAVIVGYKEKTLHNAGLSHVEISENLSTERWVFTGDISVEVMALTNLERDYISDHIIGLFAFGSFLQIPFETDIVASTFIDLQVNLKALIPSGEQTMAGVTWGLTDSRIYSCSYSFPVLGAFTSTPNYDAYIASIQAKSNLIGLNSNSENTNIVPPLS
jgi:hypothetical protein